MRIFKTIKKWSDKFAIWMTKMVSTTACVLLFTVWSLLPLFWHASEPIVLYVSSGILQLVLLPMIMVGQNLLGKSQERRAATDHGVLLELRKEMDILLELANNQQQSIAKLLDDKNKS